VTIGKKRLLISYKQDLDFGRVTLLIWYDKLEKGISWLVSALRHEFSFLCELNRKSSQNSSASLSNHLHA